MKALIYLSSFIYGVSIIYCLICVISLSDKYRTLEYKYEELKKTIEDKKKKKKSNHMKLYEGDN